mmetsp:Transcript_17778/g.55232  ORF Transcript_17778/g.55232 Transcript_17778/m.55232 type:complete len:306 (+) Transcript_17778:1951-2868(+)
MPVLEYEPWENSSVAQSVTFHATGSGTSSSPKMVRSTRSACAKAIAAPPGRSTAAAASPASSVVRMGRPVTSAPFQNMKQRPAAALRAADWRTRSSPTMSSSSDPPPSTGAALCAARSGGATTPTIGLPAKAGWLSQNASGNSSTSFSRPPKPSRSIALVLAVGSTGSKAMLPALSTPKGTVTITASHSTSSIAPLSVRSTCKVTARPGPSVAPYEISRTARPSRTSSPFASRSAIVVQPPPIILCSPPKAPKSSSSVQCCRLSEPSLAEQPYSRCATCHSKRRSTMSSTSGVTLATCCGCCGCS